MSLNESLAFSQPVQQIIRKKFKEYAYLYHFKKIIYVNI